MQQPFGWPLNSTRFKYTLNSASGLRCRDPSSGRQDPLSAMVSGPPPSSPPLAEYHIHTVPDPPLVHRCLFPVPKSCLLTPGGPWASLSLPFWSYRCHLTRPEDSCFPWCCWSSCCWGRPCICSFSEAQQGQGWPLLLNHPLEVPAP